MADNLARELRALGFRTRTTHRRFNEKRYLADVSTLAVKNVGRTCIIVAVSGYSLPSGRFVMALKRRPTEPLADAYEADYPTMLDAVHAVMERAGIPVTR